MTTTTMTTITLLTTTPLLATNYYDYYTTPDDLWLLLPTPAPKAKTPMTCKHCLLCNRKLSAASTTRGPRPTARNTIQSPARPSYARRSSPSLRLLVRRKTLRNMLVNAFMALASPASLVVTMVLLMMTFPSPTRVSP